MRLLGRPMKMPPSRLGRLLIALRESVGLRALNPDADPKFHELVRSLNPGQSGGGLSRAEAVEWVQAITGRQLDVDRLRRLETGARSDPQPFVLEALLAAYGLSKSEREQVCKDPNLNRLAGQNPHLIGAWRMSSLAVGEFGPMVGDALRVESMLSTWLEVEKAGAGGFRAHEVRITVDPTPLARPALFEKRAADSARENELRSASGQRGWTDKPTFSLCAVTSSLGDTDEERNQIHLILRNSSYRYNVAAKQEIGAEMRWRALQEAHVPLTPVPHLASGVGLCLNVICDEGTSMIIGQRSAIETFRKHEFDVAVVEGIRPADAQECMVDVETVVRRALREELGLGLVDGYSWNEVVKRCAIFELGCDLEYYQWNFLGFVEMAAPFELVYAAWQKAPDRKENRTLQTIPFNRGEVTQFVLTKPIWSSGIACALRTFDYY